MSNEPYSSPALDPPHAETVRSASVVEIDRLIEHATARCTAEVRTVREELVRRLVSDGVLVLTPPAPAPTPVAVPPPPAAPASGALEPERPGSLLDRLRFRFGRARGGRGATPAHQGAQDAADRAATLDREEQAPALLDKVQDALAEVRAVKRRVEQEVGQARSHLREIDELERAMRGAQVDDEHGPLYQRVFDHREEAQAALAVLMHQYTAIQEEEQRLLLAERRLVAREASGISEAPNEVDGLDKR